MVHMKQTNITGSEPLFFLTDKFITLHFTHFIHEMWAAQMYIGNHIQKTINSCYQRFMKYMTNIHRMDIVYRYMGLTLAWNTEYVHKSLLVVKRSTCLTRHLKNNVNRQKTNIFTDVSDKKKAIPPFDFITRHRHYIHACSKSVIHRSPLQESSKRLLGIPIFFGL